MKNPCSLILFLLLGSVAATLFADSHCYQRHNINALIAPWVKKDKAYLNNRRDLYVYISPSPQSFRFYETRDVSYMLKSTAIGQVQAKMIQQQLRKISQHINLRFHLASAAKADLVIHAVCMPEYKDDYGYVGENKAGNKAVMVINECMRMTRSEQPAAVLKLVFLHEMGHVLGLEHPFDDKDNDCLYSTSNSGKHAATLTDTLMAYKEDPGKPTPSWYTPLDMKTLIHIWGKAKK